MSAVEVVKKAQNNLTCPVCYQLFKNPKYLPCYHSYCEGCLEKMQVQSKIICPECRKEAKVPAGGVKELPNNFFINRLVDDLILKKKVVGELEVKCDECDNDPVVSFCPECNFFFCLACNDHHTRSKLYRGHAIVPLTELKSNKDASIQAKVKMPLCKEHDEQLKYYCETCDELVCMYCTVKKHNRHHHDSVKQMATKHRNELKKITDPIEGMIKNLTGAHDNIEKMMKKTRRRGEEVDKQIDQYYDELLQKLMKQKDEVKQQAHDAVSQKEKAMITQLEEVTSMQAKLMSMKELTDALEQSSDQEALSAKKQVTDRVHQLTNAYKKVNIQPVESAAMDFVPTKDPFPAFGNLVNPHTSEIQQTTSNKTTFSAVQESIFNTASGINKGVIQLGSLSNDVLALMQKCGIYKHDHLTYDTGGGCVIVECPGDDETASKIAEEFQMQYNLLMMGGKLREYSFPIIDISNQQSIDELVKQFNNDYSQSVFKFDQENKVIKCLSMSARQLSHIKTKAKDIMEKPDHDAAAGADTTTSMSMTIPGGRRITLKQANIVEEEVDVIVNAANDRLVHDVGVAAAINRASQGVVQAVSTNLMQRHGRPLETGQAVYTAAGGALKCKFIIHAVGPHGYKHGDQCQHLLWMVCMNTLQLAEKLQAISLAIPPISTGIYKVATDLVAKTIIQAVSSYPCHDKRFLQDIRIVIIDKETYEAFKPAFVDMRANPANRN